MLRYLEGFDNYQDADIISKYSHFNTVMHTSPAIIWPSAGRFGTGGSCQIGFWTSQGYFRKPIDEQPTWTIGTAFKKTRDAGGIGSIIEISDSALGNHMSLRVDWSTGCIYIYRNSTLLATSAPGLINITVGYWSYIEFSVTINAATGSYAVRVNGASLAPASLPDQSGINTEGVASAHADQIGSNDYYQTLGDSSLYMLDDIYMCDGQTGITGFQGDIRIQTRYPDAAGAHTAWTPDSGANYTRVNEALFDGDTSYVADATVGDIDTYGFSDLDASTASVIGVQQTIIARKDDAGVRQISSVEHISGTDYVNATVWTLSPDYSFFIDAPIEKNPATSVAYTVSDVNGLEAGVKVIA